VLFQPWLQGEAASINIALPGLLASLCHPAQAAGGFWRKPSPRPPGDLAESLCYLRAGPGHAANDRHAPFARGGSNECVELAFRVDETADRGDTPAVLPWPRRPDRHAGAPFRIARPDPFDQ